MTHRYALYLAPRPDSELHRFASRWLGRDAITDEALEQPFVEHVPADKLREITASPRRYGFHGTIKAPFRLAQDREPDELHRAARIFAAAWPAMALTLEVRSLRGFLALMLADRSPELDTFAAACVRDFEPFRAPLTVEEREQRERAALTPRQRAHLEHFGYPYVMEDFVFHMTLTERLHDNLHDRVLTDLCARTRPLLAEPFQADALCVFEEPEPQAPFRLTARYPLAPAQPSTESAST
jgi:putative phosphonate metabolism protein